VLPWDVSNAQVKKNVGDEFTTTGNSMEMNKIENTLKSNQELA
jgi:hypothetical protein